MKNKGKFLEHWPTVLLGLIVGVILLVAVFSYQVSETETAVVTTFAKVEDYTPEPGLHFRWPYPFQDVIKFDNRLLCFEGNEGKIEETPLADGANVMVGIYVIYRIDDAKKFYSTIGTISKAEDYLNNNMRSVKNAVFGRYKFDQLINADAAKVKFPEIEAQIQAGLQKSVKEFGIEIAKAGVNAFGQPSRITDEVLKRMVEERKLAAQEYIAAGNTEAQKIRIEADTKSRNIIATAEAKATTIRAEGDAKAAKEYEEFTKNPELAAFLRKLDALKRIMESKTTLVLDTDTAPFDLFKTQSYQLTPNK